MSQPLLEVGRIVKAHGIRGEVLVALSTDRAERVKPGTRLHGGERVLEVLTSSPHQGKWIVAFDGVFDRNTAETLHGKVLKAEPLEDPDTLWVHEAIGATVVGVDGVEHGRVTSVEENPAADLLVLESGALVPMTFVVSSAPGRIEIDPPEGLFDLL